MLHGRKRWFLYPPTSSPPSFHPNQSTYTWQQETYLPLFDDKELDVEIDEHGEVRKWVGCWLVGWVFSSFPPLGQ